MEKWLNQTIRTVLAVIFCLLFKKKLLHSLD